jgi:hypothetical protein
MKPALALILLATSGLRSALGADDAQEFNDYLKYSQDVVAKQHLIVYAKVEPDNAKQKVIEFRYDHYPELERMKPSDGASYVRKKGAGWIKSEDWGKTGKPAPAKATKDFDSWIDLANAPLLNIHESRDQSQGSVVPTRIDGDEKAKDNEIAFELRREHPTAVLYPRFTFSPFGGKALIHSFDGPMHYGDGHVMAHFRYDFMFQVQMQEVTPAPSSATSPAQSSSSPGATVSPGAEELLKAACRKMQRGTWKVDATLTFKKKLRIHGLINGNDFDLATQPEDGSSPMRQVTIVTLSRLSSDGGNTWKKTDAKDRGVFNWVHSPLIGNDNLPPFETVGRESHEGETWQHIRLKVAEKVEDQAQLPHYWIAVNEQGEPLSVRRFEGPVIIQGNVWQAKEEYAPSKEPFIQPPITK